jgi:hypothetical protein
MQIEGLLSGFKKLVDDPSRTRRGGGASAAAAANNGENDGGDSSPISTPQATTSVDHTYLETDTVRFVYQPMESGLYLVLVTTKGSNIIENLETLRLLSKMLQEICHSKPAASSTQSAITNEDTVLGNAFDIVFAFDEAISFGYREPVTSTQINQYVEMESHEERLHQMIQQSKENEAKETARRKQLELAEMRKKQAREEKMAAAMGLAPPGPPSGQGMMAAASSSMGGGATGGAFETSMDGGGFGSADSFDRARRQEDLLARQAALVAAGAKSTAPVPTTWNPSMNAEAVDYTAQSTSAPKKGMSLGARRPGGLQ